MRMIESNPVAIEAFTGNSCERNKTATFLSYHFLQAWNLLWNSGRQNKHTAGPCSFETDDFTGV